MKKEEIKEKKELEELKMRSELQNAIREQAREDEQEQSRNFTLRKILGGDFLTARMIRQQIGLILLIVFFTIIYISNRYSCDKNLIEIDRLNKELQDAKFKALSSSSELTERCRESNVLQMLKNNKDSTLKIPSQPPYIINTPEISREVLRRCCQLSLSKESLSSLLPP